METSNRQVKTSQMGQKNPISAPKEPQNASKKFKNSQKEILIGYLQSYGYKQKQKNLHSIQEVKFDKSIKGFCFEKKFQKKHLVYQIK